MTYSCTHSTHKVRCEIERHCETLFREDLLPFLYAAGYREEISGYTTLAELQHMAEDVLFNRFIDSEDGSWL